jgi:hypothetical protein
MATLMNPNAAYRPMVARPVASQDDRFVYLAVILGYILLLPPQLNLTVMGVVLPPYRLFLIPATLLVVGANLRGRWNWVLPDYLMLIGTAWIWLALYNTSPFEDFFTSSIAQTVDIGLAYFFARAAFQSMRDIRLFLLMMVPGLAIAGGFIVLEAVLKRHILQPFVGGIVGVGGYYPIDERMGLMRSRGPFPHPILAGIFFASFLPLYWMSGLRGWPRIVGIGSAFFSFFTVSSAALLAISVSSMLMLYNWLSERFAQLTWRLFFIGAGILIFALELGTQSGSFNLIMRYASLNSYSAFNRVLIWRYGTKNVADNPLFGIGYAEWERPSWMVSGSLDHYWLQQAIQFGLVPPTMLAVATILAVLAVIRKSQGQQYIDKMALRGLAIAMAVFALGIVSVSIWLSTQVWFHMMLGMCVSIGYAVAAANRVPNRPVQAPPQNMRTSALPPPSVR